MTFLYLDIETNGLDPFTCDVVTIQVLTASGRTIIVKNPEQNMDKVEKIKRRLEANTIVGQNIKFDSKFLKHHFDITMPYVYDTYIAELVLSGGQLAGRKGASLKDLALRYCGKYLDKEAQTTFVTDKQLTRKQKEYARDDLAYLPQIMKQQMAKIELENLGSVINTEMKAIPSLVWLELSGIYIDMEKVNDIRVQALSDLKEARDLLNVELTEETAQQTLFGGFERTKVNLDSPVEMLNALKKKGFNIYSTSEVELAKYGKDPIIKAVLKYREASKMLSTFVDVLPTRRNPETGRIHADFNQFGAKSGRFTCRNPNLQQQPKSYDWRDIFRAEPGNVFVTSDYSQIELRIIGQVSGDSEFIRAYNEKEDLHSLTASKVFKVPIKEFAKPRPSKQEKQRSIAKTVNFGIAYGMGPQGLKGNLQKAGIEISDEEAVNIISEFNRAYPSVSRHLNGQANKGLSHLCIRNAAGRLFKFEEPHDGREIGRIKRESKNLPIQSLCADMVKDALAVLFFKLEPMGVKFVNTVHDELVFECKKEQADEVAAIVKEEMEKAGQKYLTSMPCVAEVTVSEVWEK